MEFLEKNWDKFVSDLTNVASNMPKGLTIKKKIKIEHIISNDKQCVDQRKMNKINESLGNISFVL